MANPIWTNPIKHPEDVGVGVWRRRINLGQTGFITGIPVVALEKGCIPLRAYVRIEEAFNAGTTNVLVLGSAADDDGLITTANAAAAALGFKAGTGAELGTELAADTQFFAKFTQTGTAATTGIAEFIVEFCNPPQLDALRNEETGLMPKIEYITDGDADEVEVFGVSFRDGKAVDVSDDVAARLKGNPYFKVSHSAKKSEDDEAAKAKADQEKADRAAEAAKARAEKEAADKAAAEEADRLKAEQGHSTLKAVHNGGGRFVIKDGDKIVKDGLNKADADAFNALTDGDKAEYVKD